MLNDENKDFKKGTVIEAADTYNSDDDDGKLNQNQSSKAGNEYLLNQEEPSKRDEREGNTNDSTVYKAKPSEEKRNKPNPDELLAEFLKETRRSIPHSKRDIDASLLLDIVTFFATKGITIHSSDVYRLLVKKVLSSQKDSRGSESEDNPDGSEEPAETYDSDELMEVQDES